MVSLGTDVSSIILVGKVPSRCTCKLQAAVLPCIHVYGKPVREIAGGCWVGVLGARPSSNDWHTGTPGPFWTSWLLMAIGDGTTPNVLIHPP